MPRKKRAVTMLFLVLALALGLIATSARAQSMGSGMMGQRGNQGGQQGMYGQYCPCMTGRGMMGGQGMMGRGMMMNPSMMGRGNTISQNDDGHTARGEAEGKTIWGKLQAEELKCDDLTNKNFGALGEYFMGRMAGGQHAALNNMMIQMMGEEGEEIMHIAMGKRMSNCEPNAPMPQNMMSGGMMSMMMNMMMGGQGMPGRGMMMNPNMMGRGMMRDQGKIGQGMMMKPNSMGRGGYGQQYGQSPKPLKEDDVRIILENYISAARNPNLKLGKITENEDFFEAEIVTKEGSLVDKLIVGKLSGMLRSIY